MADKKKLEQIEKDLHLLTQEAQTLSEQAAKKKMPYVHEQSEQLDAELSDAFDNAGKSSKEAPLNGEPEFETDEGSPLSDEEKIKMQEILNTNWKNSKKIKTTSKSNIYALVMTILAIILFLLLLNKTVIQQRNEIITNTYIQDEDVLNYINTTHPTTSIEKIEVKINSAVYDDESGILRLEYLITNNNDNVIRFLTSSFRMEMGEKVLTPILIGDINENDVNTAKGIQPGTDTAVQLSYAVNPADLAGEVIQLKGVFITNVGTYDINYMMPSSF